MKPILIIDPGHGGKDPGGGSNKYWKEKDMNLQISLYQFSRFNQLGVPVAITRQTDKTLSADERSAIVRNSGAAYCHSNHINAGGGDGAEVIHSIYGGRALAEKTAAGLKNAGQNVRRVFTRTLPNNATLDYYFMHRNTGSVVTTIIEYGFSDSPKSDVDQLRKDWKRYAEAVVKAFCEFGNYEYISPDGNVSRTQKQKTRVQAGRKYLHLPSDANSWRVYPLGATPVKGNEKGFLRPSKFGGLVYEIIGETVPHVYVIQTSDFGKVQIYAHPNTGANITDDR